MRFDRREGVLLLFGESNVQQQVGLSRMGFWQSTINDRRLIAASLSRSTETSAALIISGEKVLNIRRPESLLGDDGGGVGASVSLQ